MEEEIDKVGRQSRVEIRTLLKFVPSERNGSMVSYVSQNPSSGQIKGVRVDSEYPHKIVVCSKDLSGIILSNVLYNAVIIPMKSGKGYICTSAEPVQFKATITTNYVPKSTYQIVVSFGNKNLVFDPFKGKKSTVMTVNGFVDMLEHRMDLKNQHDIVFEFKMLAEELLRRMKKDDVSARIG